MHVEILGKTPAEAPDLPSHLFPGCGSDFGTFRLVGGTATTKEEIAAVIETDTVDPVQVNSYDADTGLGSFAVVDGDAPEPGTVIPRKSRADIAEEERQRYQAQTRAHWGRHAWVAPVAPSVLEHLGQVLRLPEEQSQAIRVVAAKLKEMQKAGDLTTALEEAVPFRVLAMQGIAYALTAGQSPEAGEAAWPWVNGYFPGELRSNLLLAASMLVAAASLVPLQTQA